MSETVDGEKKLKYHIGLKEKVRDKSYRLAVLNVVRSIIVGLSVFALFIVVLYVLRSFPKLKSESLIRFKRLKENALNKACIPPEKKSLEREAPLMCETAHGSLRCNNTGVVVEEEQVSFVKDEHLMKALSLCDEDTMYYRSINIEYEARVESLLRLVHLEANICGPTCVEWVETITNTVTNHPPLIVFLLAVTMSVFQWSIVDCHKSRKRVRAALDDLSTKTPSFLQTNEKED